MPAFAAAPRHAATPRIFADVCHDMLRQRRDVAMMPAPACCRFAAVFADTRLCAVPAVDAPFARRYACFRPRAAYARRHVATAAALIARFADSFRQATRDAAIATTLLCRRDFRHYARR